MNIVYGMAMVAVFIWNGVFYGMVWSKINTAKKNMANRTDSQKKYHRLAKVVCVTGLILILQLD